MKNGKGMKEERNLDKQKEGKVNQRDNKHWTTLKERETETEPKM